MRQCICLIYNIPEGFLLLCLSGCEFIITTSSLEFVKHAQIISSFYNAEKAGNSPSSCRPLSYQMHVHGMHKYIDKKTKYHTTYTCDMAVLKIYLMLKTL